jgi:hypothetical protein
LITQRTAASTGAKFLCSVAVRGTPPVRSRSITGNVSCQFGLGPNSARSQWCGWMRCKLDEARSFADGRRRTKLSKVLLDYVFIPFEANAWRIGNVQQPVLQPVGILENGISPVLPFKPMCRFCDAHHMRRHFGVEMS